jgi:hypothetical protein
MLSYVLLLSDPSLTTSAPGVDIDSLNTDQIKAALELARHADVVVLALGTDKVSSIQPTWWC